MGSKNTSSAHKKTKITCYANYQRYSGWGELSAWLSGDNTVIGMLSYSAITIISSGVIVPYRYMNGNTKLGKCICSTYLVSSCHQFHLVFSLGIKYSKVIIGLLLDWSERDKKHRHPLVPNWPQISGIWTGILQAYLVPLKISAVVSITAGHLPLALPMRRLMTLFTGWNIHFPTSDLILLTAQFHLCEQIQLHTLLSSVNAQHRRQELNPILESKRET